MTTKDKSDQMEQIQDQVRTRYSQATAKLKRPWSLAPHKDFWAIFRSGGSDHRLVDAIGIGATQEEAWSDALSNIEMEEASKLAKEAEAKRRAVIGDNGLIDRLVERLRSEDYDEYRTDEENRAALEEAFLAGKKLG